RLGEKPLYYTLLANGFLLFGSELKALLQHPGIKRDIDPLAVEDYFAYGYIPDPRTIYRDVFKLPPAHKLLLRRDEGSRPPQAYWDVSFHETRNVDENELCDELITRLGEAVRMRMVADVPLGAFLSGGVDSSSVVAMMAGASITPVDT